MKHEWLFVEADGLSDGATIKCKVCGKHVAVSARKFSYLGLAYELTWDCPGPPKANDFFFPRTLEELESAVTAIVDRHFHPGPPKAKPMLPKHVGWEVDPSPGIMRDVAYAVDALIDYLAEKEKE